MKKFLSSYPELVKEWHPTKNGELTPDDFTYGSGKKVWWLCPEGHDYVSSISHRTNTKNPTGCPYCSGRYPSHDNNLLVLFPNISKEWHPSKNDDLTPKDFKPKSHKKVWWLCPKGHDYNSSISHRTDINNPTGCPFCSNQSSEPEIRILSELKWFFDEINSRYKINGVEIDIFLPSFNLGIEYDGSYFHKDKEDSDLRKNKFLLSQNINLIRVREHPLLSLSEHDVVINKGSLEKTDLDEILRNISFFIGDTIKEKVNDYVVKTSFINQELFLKYRSYFPSPFPENSLLKTHPLISSEWHYERNHPLIPENFSYGSSNRVWWLCPKGHDYKSRISARTRKLPNGCPYCSGMKVGHDNNLLVLFPNISKEWHPTKNEDLTPKDFTSGTKKKVWWLCPKGHDFESSISDRTRRDSPRKCPYCSGRYPSHDNNLLVLFPNISKEWHPTKNGDLTPKDFTSGTKKKVWWLCPKGHDFESSINKRTKVNPSGCPYCSGRYPSQDNNLLVLFPNISKEWHPTKNGDLTPKDVTSGTTKKIWWLCPKGHSYESVVGYRTTRNWGCPYCSGRKKSEE